MRLRDWLRPPRYTLPLFLAVMLGPAAATIWLGWRLLDLDHALARDQVRDRLEHAADLIAADLGRELETIADQIPAWLVSRDAPRLGNNALVVALTPVGVDARAGAPLLYVPARFDVDPPASIWTPGELYEFRDNDYAKAAAAFRTLARSDDRRIRAGALVRLARNLRKTNKPIEALESYAALTDLGDVAVAGEPAALVARLARCRLLRDLGRTSDAGAEATRILDDLAIGRWSVDRAGFLMYRDQARQCSAEAIPSADQHDALALAAAVDILWREWRQNGRQQDEWRGRRSVWIDDRGVLLVWRASPERLVAFVAGTEDLAATSGRVLADQQASVTLIDGDGHHVLGDGNPSRHPEAARMGTDTRLPWTVRVVSAAPTLELADIARRRRLLLAGLGLVAFLVLTGSYFVARAIQKELAIARLQSDLVSAVSHEFRTPLTSMRYVTDLLKDGQVGSDDRRQQYYEVLARDTERLHRFVETLLNFGRMDAAAEQYRFEHEEPVSLVSQIVDEFRAEPVAQHRRVSVSTKGGLPPAWIDREAFARALWNLLDNAAKYSADDAPIDVELGTEGDRITISVNDRGPGIPAADHKRIFQKFVRGTDSRKSGVKGTGVGLAIVQHVVRAHGGQVRVTSGMGRGSTFTMVIPTVERHA